MALFRALQGIAPHLDAAMVLNVCEGTGLVVSVRDDQGTILHYSGEVAARLGAEGAGQAALRYFDEDGRELDPAEQPQERVRLTGEDVLNAVSRIEGPGGTVWVQMSFTALAPGDAGYHVLGIGSDITARREAEAMLERMATHDGLTGLLNRIGLRARAEEPFLSALDGGAFAIALLDIDHFKAVNDTHGHAVGDAVLAAVAASIRDAAPVGAVCGRWGGEEFLIVLPGSSRDAALASAEVIRRAVAATAVRIDEVEGAAPAPADATDIVGPAAGVPGELCVTASLGVAALPAAGTLTALIRQADDALYVAKREGRDRVAA